jgi:predicted DNA-binding transcriptional regulator AlpA
MTEIQKKHSKAIAPLVDTDRLVSIPDTCATLYIGTTKCYGLINQGVLEVVRLGGRCTRIKKSSIDRLIQNGVSVSKEAP